LANEIEPFLQAVISGKRDVASQDPFNEAWFAVALFHIEPATPVPLEEVLYTADGINHAIPNPDEIAWAFFCLLKRGWLMTQGNTYGLTNEGRDAIKRIVSKSKGRIYNELEELKGWVSTHAPPSK
jgi:hypothetical protein